MSNEGENVKSRNFLEQIIEKDIQEGKHNGTVQTRFPPEPNGYLHIGHAKSIYINFELAKKYKGKCNLRFDDTNPEKESQEYVDAIKKDVQWLGYQWDKECYASDYFDTLYEYAKKLIEAGKAYVDEQPQEKIAEQRGTPQQPGIESPYRNRPIEESLDLLERMKNGEFEEGSKVLRAKIDMSSPNMQMRDPAMYRIRKAAHHRTGSKWKIYPMYDWAHGQSDSIENVTHSFCTLEFENHRPLYNWFIEHLGIFPSAQNEFARLNLNYTVTSKRKLQQLVHEGHVNGWDDPRMPTISGLRRRGYTPEAIKNFVERVGVAKRENIVDVSLLEFCIREDLNKKAPRRMAVLNPLKVVITNYPEGQTEQVQIENNPEDPEAGTRNVPFSREVWIEQSDFMEDPPRKFFRLGPGKEVRLKGAYIIKCESYDKEEATGRITTLYCTYDPATKSGQDTTGKKVKGTLSWVPVAEGLEAEVRLYDRLFSHENPDGDKEKDFKEFLNPNSLEVIKNAKIEPALKGFTVGEHIQFLRQGYFCLDPDSSEEFPIFNRTVTLRDAWAKEQKKK